MIKGIGVDMVDVREIMRYMETFKQTFINKTFTPREVEASALLPNPAEYLAARFAAKEAVFKAIARLTKEKGFDFRIVETLNEIDGHPFVNISGELKTLMNEADITSLLISITTEGDYATAFVVAETNKN
jgi:holo-[acyl-carrier protein] synthase